MNAGHDLLSSSDDVLRTVVQGALSAVVVIGHDGLVRGWGPQAARTFGWSRDEAIGCELAEMIIPPEHRDRHRAGIARYLKTREAKVIGRVVEMEAVLRSGDRIPVEISINPPFERQGQTLFIAFIRDISDRKRGEALQARLYEETKHANQMLRDFSSLMVHELRRPLAVIQAYSSVLADGKLSDRPAEAQRALEELKRQSQAANELVDRLLMVARADAGALTPQLEKLDVCELIAGLTRRTSATAALADADVITRCSVRPGAATGDPSWTSLVLDNLLNNALIHSGARPRIEIEALEGDTISIWVTDHGAGIPEEARPKLFERFFQVHHGNDVAGSGLGLHLSRLLARLQGGDLVLVPSPPGGGARFRFDLQRSPADATPQARALAGTG